MKSLMRGTISERNREPFEHAVMSNALLHVVNAAVIGDRGAQSMRRFGLSEAGNVVFLAFDRHQRDARDLRGLHELAAMVILALGQRMLDEDGFDVCR